MAKSKYAPALFEVISKDKTDSPGKLSLPKWWNRGKTVQSQPTPTSTTTASTTSPAQPATPPATEAPIASQPVAQQVVTTPEPVLAPAESAPVRPSHPTWSAGDEAPSPPVFKVEDGRVSISLNWTNATVVAGVLLLTIFCSFLIGQKAGGGGATEVATTAAPGVDPLDEVRSAPPKGEVLRVQSAGATPARTTTPPQTQRPRRTEVPAGTAGAVSVSPAAQEPVPAAPTVRSGTVVVFENFSANHRESAEFAQKWLQEKGIAARVERNSRGGFRLVSEPFEDDAKARQAADTVRQMGRTISRELTRAGLPNYLFTSPLVVKDK